MYEVTALEDTTTLRHRGTHAECRKRVWVWMAVGHRLDCAEIINGDGEVIEFYERGKGWTTG